ncbi:MAG: hypothetical protein H0U45_14115 [Tatlockia sp.]|nr:hypothetical protein [Tatlockia sp.]
MSQINYASMTLDEAKSYFLEHRNDTEAFHAYMDKLHDSGRAIVIDPADPESEAKAISAIQQKLDLHPQG